MKKIKVVRICAFSTEEIRTLMPKKISVVEKLLYKIISKKIESVDIGPWNVIGIKQYEGSDEVELHVICPTRRIKERVKEFDIRGIHYHFFKDESTSLIHRAWRYLFTRYSSQFKKNRKVEMELINKIQPDIVHIVGAENYFYSNVIHDIPENIPTIVLLQTLVSDPRRSKAHYPNPKLRKYALESEQKILKRADYLATASVFYKDVIENELVPDATILKLGLCNSNEPNLEPEKKEFDFVYFARDIKKAFDLVMESFALTYKQHPEITLDVIGECSAKYRQEVDRRLGELGIREAVTFEGLLPTIDDVVAQVRKSRFAVLPIKGDMISQTIIQAMTNGLPTVTCITPGTPSLNRNRESVLLSEVGDNEAMSANMLRLLNDEAFANTLRKNAGQTILERQSPKQTHQRWIRAFKGCIDNHQNGTAIPEDLFFDKK